LSRRRKSEVWDASHFALVEMWQNYSHLFPRSFHLRSRLVEPSPDVVEAAAAYGEEPMPFFSASLSCGHVVQVPEEVILVMRGQDSSPNPSRSKRSARPVRRPLVPCYKCWAFVNGGALGAVVTMCSFCGVPHESAVPCIRPHLER